MHDLLIKVVGMHIASAVFGVGAKTRRLIRAFTGRLNIL